MPTIHLRGTSTWTASQIAFSASARWATFIAFRTSAMCSSERILHPLRRVGERGEGKWRQISWDEALAEIADSMLDAIASDGPESIVRVGTPGQGGVQSMALAGALFNKLGCTLTDVQGEVNDWSPGIYMTFGRFLRRPGCEAQGRAR